MNGNNIKALGVGILLGTLCGGFFILLSYLPLWAVGLVCLATGGGLFLLGDWLTQRKKGHDA